MKMRNSDIKDLLIKHLEDRITPEELTILKEWKGKSKDRQDFVEGLFDNDRLIYELREFNSYSPDKSWNQLEKQIKKNSGPVIRFHTWTKVAAIFIAIVASTFVLFELSKNSAPTQTATFQVNKTESFNAILRIDQGEEIRLRDTMDYQLAHRSDDLKGLSGELGIGTSSSVTKDLIKSTKMEIEVPRSAEYNFKLPDGSNVWLNAGSKIAFMQPFEKNKRHVILEGEAYFDVKHDPRNPFTVSIGTNQIKVLGTSFNVRAYPDEIIHNTVLVEGQIVWQTKKGNERAIEPNQTLSFNTKDESMEVRNTDVQEHIAWKDGRFYFNRTSLEEIMNTLSRWYGIRVDYRNADIKNLHFSMDIEKYEHLNSVLELLQGTRKIDIETEGSTLVIRTPE